MVAKNSPKAGVNRASTSSGTDNVPSNTKGKEKTNKEKVNKDKEKEKVEKVPKSTPKSKSNSPTTNTDKADAKKQEKDKTL